MVKSEAEIVERLADYMRRHPGAKTRQVYSCVKGSNSRLMALAKKKVGVVSNVATPFVKAITAKNGKTLDQFRKDHDVALKIRNGLKKLEGVYMTDNEFRDFCGVHVSNWRRYADLDEFRDNKIRIQGVMHWAQASFIRKMKEILGIAI